MVDQDLSVDPEGLVEVLLIPLRTGCNITHREHEGLLQSSGLSGTDLPEVCQRLMIPEQEFVGILIQLRNSDAILIRRTFLGYDIHRDLRQVQVSSDPDCRRNTGGLKHVLNHGHRHHVGSIGIRTIGLLLISVQIAAHVDKALINGIDVYVLRCYIPKIDRIDLC